MNTRNFVIAAAILGGGLFIYRSLQMPAPTPAGAALASVLVPDLSSDAQEGETLFNRSCADCHGKNAAGQDGIAPPLIHRIYEPSHHGDASFHLAAKNGARAHHWQFGNMPPVEGITDPELDKIVFYVREVQRANGIN